MGIYDRDYIFRRAPYGGQIPPVCKYLIIANVVVFLLQIFITRPMTPEDLKSLAERNWPWWQKQPPREDRKSPSNKKTLPPQNSANPSSSKSKSSAEVDKTQPEDEEKAPAEEIDEDNGPFSIFDRLPRVSVVQEWFQLEANKVVGHGQIWRLITCAFCHDRFGVYHIFFNMLFLFWFGRMLEPLYGSKEFLLFYLTAAVVASLCYIGLDLWMHQSVPAIGASGAVMAVVVLYAIHHPREQFLLFMIFPIEIRWLVLIYVIFDLHPVLLALAGTPVPTGIGNAAHLGGAAFGYLYWRYRLRLEDTWDRIDGLRRGLRVRLQRKVRLYQPSGESAPDDFEAMVDKILEKIHKEGQESLTRAERDVLKTAAERRKSRSKA